MTKIITIKFFPKEDDGPLCDSRQFKITDENDDEIFISFLNQLNESEGIGRIYEYIEQEIDE